jgi:hypothetical protein
MTAKTKPSTPELVPGARHAVAPHGIVSTGWPRIKQTCANIGWRFDPWQDATGRLILAKRADGGWASDLSILSIPRQVGKSYLLGCIIFALCLLQPKLRVIWTSHHTATTEEMYEAMKELAAHKRVAPHVKKCIALQGSRWRIIFSNGSRIDFGARERGFGRGKARVGVLVLDEFQHITMRALSNLTPTTNTAENPLILCAGTPPAPHDNAEAFSMRRKAALEGISSDTLFVEFSADQDADSNDRKQWAKANPSFPKRTPERAFLLNQKVLDDENFRREFLGIWDADDRRSIMPNWPLLVSDIEPEPAAFGLALDVDRVWLSLGASSAGDAPHLGDVFRVRLSDRRAEALAEVARLCAEHGVSVALDVKGPAASLLEELEALDVPILPAGLDDYLQACADLFDEVDAKQLTHSGNDDLNAAVAAAGWRLVNSEAGRRAWSRKNGDVSMLEAVTLARWGANQSSIEPWGAYT